MFPIPPHTLFQRHPVPAEAVQRTTDGEVDLPAAEGLDAVQVRQGAGPAGVGHGDGAPLRQALDEGLVDALLEALVVGGVDEELGAVGLKLGDGFCRLD